MAPPVKDVDNASPNHRTSVRFFYGHGLGKRGSATVLGSTAVRNVATSIIASKYPRPSLPSQLVAHQSHRGPTMNFSLSLA